MVLTDRCYFLLQVPHGTSKLTLRVLLLCADRKLLGQAARAWLSGLSIALWKENTWAD